MYICIYCIYTHIYVLLVYTDRDMYRSSVVGGEEIPIKGRVTPKADPVLNCPHRPGQWETVHGEQGSKG